MSRPAKNPLFPINKTISITINIPMLKALDEMAHSYGKSRSEVVRDAVRDAYGKFQRNKEIPSE